MQMNTTAAGTTVEFNRIANNICADLSMLGVPSGGILMCHVGLRKLQLGRPHGADILLSALRSAVGTSGTLLMILGTASPHEFLNSLPISERGKAAEGCVGIDISAAPALEEVGAFAEFFRRQPDVVLSSNPNARFAAIGPHAEMLFHNQPWDDYYGTDSPLHRAYLHNGYILRLGADDATVTALHYAEHRAIVANKRRTRWDYVLATPQGHQHVWVEGLDDAEGIADYAGEDYFADILREWRLRPDYKHTEIRGAVAELLPFVDFVDFGATWMGKHL